MTKNAYYFPHDSNAKDDPKCVLLIEQLGLEGYGTYWVLIETLRDQPGYRYPLALVPALARRFNTSSEKINTVIHKYGLFQVDEEDFFSPSLIRRMEPLDLKREQNRIAGKISAQKRLMLNTGSTHVQNVFDAGSTSVQPEEKRITEKKKEEERREDLGALSAAAMLEKSYQKIFSLYEDNIGMLSPIISDNIKLAFNEYPMDWIIKAIEKATSLEKRSWGYVDGILKGWKRDGFNNGSKNNGNGHKVKDPLWGDL